MKETPFINKTLPGRQTAAPSNRRARSTMLWLALLLATASVRVAAAEHPRDATIRELLKRQEELLQRVQGLEEQVRHLQAPRPEWAGVEAQGEAAPLPDAVAALPRFPDLSIRGFGDVNYSYSDREGQNNAFGLGQLDLFLTSRLAESFGVLNELVFKAGSDNKFGVEVERLLLQWTPSDYFNLDIGRYHTSVGYYNSTYHHGSWFQTAVNRPFIHAFNGILPIHNTGLSAYGHIPSGKLGLRYMVELGNGRHYGKPSEETDLTITDDNDYKAVNLALIARPDWVPGLQLGASFYHDWLSPDGLPRIDQIIIAGHVVYRQSPWEWLNEVLWLRHDPRGAAAPTSTVAAYTELSRQFGRFRPHVRYQYQDAPGSDLIFRNFGVVGLRHGPSLGLRYDMTDYAALKVQWDHVRQQGKPAANDLTVQVGFTF